MLPQICAALISILVGMYLNTHQDTNHKERLIHMELCKCCKQKKYNTYYKFVPVCLGCFRRIVRASCHFA